MADLDFMVNKRIVLKSDQEPSIVALCDTFKNGWHGEIVPEPSSKGESKTNGEVERAVQSVHGLARTLKDFLDQKSGIALESPSPLLAWLVEHCSNLLLPFHKGEPHDGHTVYRVDYRKRTRHVGAEVVKRRVCGVRVKTTERIVMDETETYVVQSVRRVPEEQRYDHKLLRSVRGSPWEPNPGDVSTDLPEPMLIVPQLPDVEPAPTQTYHSDNRRTRNIYIRKTDLERCGHTAGRLACQVHRAGLPMSGQEHTAECRKPTRGRDDE